MEFLPQKQCGVMTNIDVKYIGDSPFSCPQKWTRETNRRKKQREKRPKSQKWQSTSSANHRALVGLRSTALERASADLFW